jgi:heme A synthase
MVLFLWVVTVNTQILRAALEWPPIACVGLVIAQVFVGYLIIAAVFPMSR